MGGFSYPDYYSFEAELMPEMLDPNLFGIFIAVYLLFMFIAFAISVVSYILSSLGMYTIANRRGIRNAWLAWIPIGQLWILGSISDQYQYLVRGKIKNHRKVMLVLSIAPVALYFITVICLIAMIIAAEATIAASMVLCVVATIAIAITLAVYQYIAFYDLFRSCDPHNAAMYLVLSILFNITLPFFVFACRKKDTGMPPRKQTPAQVIAEPAQTEDAGLEEVEEGFAKPEEFEEE